MKVVLDSNIAIAAMNHVAAVVERLAKMPAEDVAIPMAAIAELAYGARRSRRGDQNLERLTALREQFAAMPVSDAVADRYGGVRSGLQARVPGAGVRSRVRIVPRLSITPGWSLSPLPPFVAGSIRGVV